MGRVNWGRRDGVKKGGRGFFRVQKTAKEQTGVFLITE